MKGDRVGKVSILECDSICHCEWEKVPMNKFLILNGYRESAMRVV